MLPVVRADIARVNLPTKSAVEKVVKIQNLQRLNNVYAIIISENLFGSITDYLIHMDWVDGLNIGMLVHNTSYCSEHIAHRFSQILATMSCPNPINIMANMSEMFAMQKGNPSQGVMNMTQIICYRSQTAPAGKKFPKAPAWVKKFPKAPYITLSPDMMQEVLWAQIAKKVSGIMFHGYNSLFTDPASLGMSEATLR